MNREAIKRQAVELKHMAGLSPLARLWYLELGGDPEIFFKTKKRGASRGAERIIAANGLSAIGGKITLDGFQAEFNMEHDTCRARLGNSIQRMFQKLDKQLREAGSELVPDFSPVIEVSKREFKVLGEEVRQFGCKPSFNAHDDCNVNEITVDPAVYRVRAAGGHIHLGAGPGATKDALRNYKKIVPVLDVLLGNTCVMLDRDPMIAERRKVYGKAGDFRKPEHGLEYRTLSNFWLRSYQLMSFVYNLARYCVAIVKQGDKRINALLDLVDMKDIERAINENDFDLAKENFMKIVPFLTAISLRENYYDEPSGEYVMSERYQFLAPTEGTPFPDRFIEVFMFFVDMGIDYWFEDDSFTHWLNKAEGHICGWEHFSSSVLIPEFKEWVLAGSPSKEEWKKR